MKEEKDKSKPDRNAARIDSNAGKPDQDRFAVAGTSETIINTATTRGRFAVAGSLTSPGLDAVLGHAICSDPGTIVNLQLRAWRDAKREYRSLQSQTASDPLETAWTLINDLGRSLVTLFGMSMAGGRTPQLRTFIDETLPNRGLRLSEEEPAVYDVLKKLVSLYEPGKHLNKTKAEALPKLSMEDLTRMMEATRCAWHWYVRRMDFSDLSAEEFGEHFTDLRTKSEY